MNLIHIAAALGAAPPVPVVTLSGENITSSVVDPANAEAGVRLRSDGLVQRFITPTYSFIDSITDWIIPHAAANADYDGRVTNVVGDAFTTSPGADGTWFDLGSNREWRLLQNVPGTATVTFDLEIRDPGSVTVASTSYTLTAFVDDLA